MTGILYVMSNNINDKLYIGITYRSLATRWAGHVDASKTRDSKIYKAMREIGTHNFCIQEIGRFEHGELERQETYHIKLYNTVENGYNSNYGGFSQQQISESTYESILYALINGASLIEISIQNKVSMQYIKDIAYKEGVDNNKCTLNCKNIKIPVVAIGIEFRHILVFESMLDAYQRSTEWYKSSIKKGHFYYQVKYALGTGNIAYGNTWHTVENLNSRIESKKILMSSCKEEDKNDRVYKTGLSYLGNEIYTTKIIIAGSGTCEKCGKEIGKYSKVCLNCRNEFQMYKPFRERQVPDSITIKHPFEKEQLSQLYPKYTVNSIARQAGVSYPTVNKALLKFGLK